MPRTSLDSLQKAAGISTELHQSNQTIQQCAKQLHQAWTALKAARKEAELLREQHLTTTAEDLAVTLNTTREKAVLIINNKEHDKRSY